MTALHFLKQKVAVEKGRQIMKIITSRNLATDMPLCLRRFTGC